MRIGIALPTLADGDAVGNDVFGMARVLRGRGHDVQFFAWTSHVAEPVRTPDELARTLTRSDDLLIYHHSIGCDWAVKAVENLPCKKVVKYHNVTPPEFFRTLNPEVAAGCEQGIRELTRLARSDARIWADSAFNADEVRAINPGKVVEELPPFHHADQLINLEPDFRAVAGLDDWAANILVVGRLVPNKNIALAVRTLAEYRRRVDSRARLIVVGDRPLPTHALEVDAVIRECGQEGQVVVTGKVTTAQLKALYLTSDALLVTSLHEGFCVPLVEAMGLRLPVVAVPNAAVPFTGGDAAGYADADPAALADALDEAMNGEPAGRERRLNAGFDRYAAKFSNAAVKAQFERLVDELH